MKYLKEEPSGRDNQVMCPVFKMGKNEARMMLGLLKTFHDSIPNKYFEMSPFKSRARNMIKCLESYLKPDGNNPDIPKDQR